MNSGTLSVLRPKQVCEELNISRSTLWRLVRSHKFPSPIKLTDHAIGWRQSDIETYLSDNRVKQVREVGS